MFLLGLHVRASRLSIYEEGLTGFIPTAVLTWIADGTEAWPDQRTGQTDLATEIVLVRMDEQRSSLISRRIWAHKGAKAYVSRLDVDPSSLRVEVYDISDLTPVVLWGERITLASGKSAPAPALSKSNYDAEDLCYAVCSSADYENWVFFGGDSAEHLLIGDQIVVAAAEPTHALIRQGLSEIRKQTWQVGQPHNLQTTSRERVFVRYQLDSMLPSDAARREERLGQLWMSIQEEVRPNTWIAMGWYEAAIYIVCYDLVVFARSDHHDEIAAYLERIANEPE